MPKKSFICSRCWENFSLLKSTRKGVVACPRCGREGLEPVEACSLEVGPPPWEFHCLDCGSRFSVQSPSGPDEAAALVCPVCHSQRIKWMALSTAACATGG